MSEITFDRVSYSYNDQWQGQEQYALENVSFHMEQGEYLAIIGETGSGKSTLLQHINGLLKPTSGTVSFNGRDIHEKGVSLQKIRQKISLCFQYPEYQLFEESIIKDICFGPSNMGYSKEECLRKARYAMDLVELPRSMENISPFSLSGGQKKRVALAGILAMEPEFLVLDEPVAGMDQRGKEHLFEILQQLNEDNDIGIILVSHDMDDVAANADRLIVMNQGHIVADDETRKVFEHREMFKEFGLELPQAVSFYYKLKDQGFGGNTEDETLPMTVKELANYVSLYLPKFWNTGGVL